MNPRRRWLLSFVWFAVTIVLGSAQPAAAQKGPDLDALRAAGTVGERYDGMAMVRSEDASADVKALVATINEKRSKIYKARAKEQGVPEEQVGRVYAAEIFEKAPAGTWFLDDSLAWKRK